MFEFYEKETLPDIFENFFCYNKDFHQHSTRQANEIHLPKFKSELGLRSFAFWGAKLWNKILSKNISLNVQPLSFKLSLKQLILDDKI